MMGKAVMRWSSSITSTSIFIQPGGMASTMLSVTLIKRRCGEGRRYLGSKRVVASDRHGEVDEEEDGHGDQGGYVELAAVGHVSLLTGNS